MVSLAYPWLMLLVLVPLLLQWRRPAGQTVDAPMLPVGHWLSGLPGVSRHGSATPLWQKLLLPVIWCMLVVALARPQHVGAQVPLPVSGRYLQLQAGISPSRDEQDMVLLARRIKRLQAG